MVLRSSLPGRRARIALGILSGMALLLSSQSTWASNCTRSIRVAGAHATPRSVAASCWGIGPVRLGDRRAAVIRRLGPADGHVQVAGVWHAVYVFPRDLAAKLDAMPSALADFKPTTLRIRYQEDRVSVLAMGVDARIDIPPCRPTRPEPKRRSMRPPAGALVAFDAFAIGRPINQVFNALGPPSRRNARRDAFGYFPLPIMIFADGRERVRAIAIAERERDLSILPTPRFQARLDPQTCGVTGYVLD